MRQGNIKVSQEDDAGVQNEKPRGAPCMKIREYDWLPQPLN